MSKYLANGWKITNVDNEKDWESAIEISRRKAQIRKQNIKKSQKKKTK